MSNENLHLNNSKIEGDYEIRNERYDDLQIASTKFLGGIIISNSEFGKVSIVDDTKIKGNVIFKNCIFKDSFILKKVTCLGSIDFIECQFHKSCKVFASKIKGSFNFLEAQVTGDILLQSVITEKLNLEEVTAKNFRVNSMSNSQIDVLSAQNTTIEHLFEISELHGAKEVNLSGCNLGFLFSIRKILSNDDINILLNNCYTKHININGLTTSKGIKLDVKDGISDKIQLINCSAKNGLIDLENTSVSGITKISYISESIKIDISRLASSDLIIDASMYQPIYKGSLNSQLLLNDLSQQLSTIQILEKYFHQNGDTRVQDKMSYMLRELEARKGEKSNAINNLLTTLRHSTGKYMFGWGVELKQLFISFGLVTLFFATIYLGMMYECDMMSFEFKDVVFKGWMAPLELSLFYMFGFFGDIQVGCIKYQIGLMQHVVGIAYLTLIIGVGIRKLVN